ncbi:helix-turn-helix domain-containing protein [Methylobacillus methanolivorans]|uniref:Helix-turn-helix domain-containing protein n=1 Tax=Methylobacillus methanolivorans TaxID=1848927 RepID=A0ABW8GNI2_9PROT
MTLQTIKSLDGKDEYVLLPIAVYEALKDKIEDQLIAKEAPIDDDDEYVPFILEDYIDNPVALARIKAGVTQQELAARLTVTQAYISKVERQDKVSPKLLERINTALGK